MQLGHNIIMKVKLGSLLMLTNISFYLDSSKSIMHKWPLLIGELYKRRTDATIGSGNNEGITALMYTIRH